MTSAEMVGLMAAVALTGIAIGLGMAALYGRRNERREIRRQLIDAFARWLTARKLLARTSITYLTKHRAWNSAAPNSGERRDCARSVRTAAEQWDNVAAELYAAEAYLVAWIQDPSLDDRVVGHVERVRAHIGLIKAGGRYNLERFSQWLEEDDEAATRALRAAIWRRSSTHVVCANALARLKRVWERLEARANRAARRS